MDNSYKEESIKLMKEAVMCFRVAELKECLEMLTVKSHSKAHDRPSKYILKAQLQKKVLSFLEAHRYIEGSIHLKFITKILELQSRVKNKTDRRRRAARILPKNPEVFGISPFFEVVEVLVSNVIRHRSNVFLYIPAKSAQLLRKKRCENDRFTHEIQFLFSKGKDDDRWTPMDIRLTVNDKDQVELYKSPPIVYLTPYCDLRKDSANKVFVEIPESDEDFILTVSVVRRFSPSQLLKMFPVKEACSLKKLLDDYFDENEESIYEVSLVCPSEKKIIEYPCRSSFCNHPDVFDLMSFLEEMQYFLWWDCPVCESPIIYNSLEMDTFLQRHGKSGKIYYSFYKKKKLITGMTFPGDNSSVEVITVE